MSSPAIRTLLGVVGFILLLVVVVVGVGLYLAYSTVQNVANQLTTDTTTTFRPRTSAGRVEFAMTYGKNVMNLAKFTVSDVQGNRLWELECHGADKPAVVVYGELPPGTAREYEQKYPPEGAKPAEIRGSPVRVEVNVRFNSPMGLGHELYRGEFNIPDAP